MSYLIKTRSEYRAHEIIKDFVNNQVVANDFQHKIYKSSLEKSFGEKRADVYFYYKSGKKVIVEIQNSPMSSKEITARTRIPLHQKDIKVSPAEIRLHQLYRGRVYYVNITQKNGIISITKPFALHFTDSEQYSNKMVRKGHECFFIKNVYSTFIPSWNILLKSYGEYKLAHFYDKNFVSTAADKVKLLVHKLPNSKENLYLNSKESKKLYNMICEELRQRFGEFLILETLQYLTAQGRLLLDSKYLVKHRKKLKKKAIKKF